MYDVAIIGGGVSGYGAALYAGRFRMKTVVIATMPGGAVINTNDIANYPGFNQISGLDLFSKIEAHAKEYDIEIINDTVTKVNKNGSCFQLQLSGKTIAAKSIIIATGSKWRKLNIPGEEKFASKGVHYCALCDGPFYKDKIIGIVGGSDSAVKEAHLLSEFAKKVYIIYRGDKLRAEPITIERAMKNDKIEIIYKTNITEIKGDQFVNEVVFDTPCHGSTDFKLDGLFIAIGHIPLSSFAKGLGVELNGKGEIVIDREAKTNIDGVFAAGDVVSTTFKQAITGVAEGVTAAYSAYHYVSENKINCK